MPVDLSNRRPSLFRIVPLSLNASISISASFSFQASISAISFFKVSYFLCATFRSGVNLPIHRYSLLSLSRAANNSSNSSFEALSKCPVFRLSHKFLPILADTVKSFINGDTSPGAAFLSKFTTMTRGIQSVRAEAIPCIVNNLSKKPASGFSHEGFLLTTSSTSLRAIRSSFSGVISALFLTSARVNFPNHSRISFSGPHGIFSSTFFGSVSTS